MTINTRDVTCATASACPNNTIAATVLVDGKIEHLRMEQHVAAALMGAIASALGSSVLYDAGLERAAKIAEDEFGDEEYRGGVIAEFIREAKIRKSR